MTVAETGYREGASAEAPMLAQKAHLWAAANCADDSGALAPGTSSWTSGRMAENRGQYGARPEPPDRP